jgi:hypothetical protein
MPLNSPRTAATTDSLDEAGAELAATVLGAACADRAAEAPVDLTAGAIAACEPRAAAAPPKPAGARSATAQGARTARRATAQRDPKSRFTTQNLHVEFTFSAFAVHDGLAADGAQSIAAPRSPASLAQYAAHGGPLRPRADHGPVFLWARSPAPFRSQLVSAGRLAGWLAGAHCAHSAVRSQQALDRRFEILRPFQRGIFEPARTIPGPDDQERRRRHDPPSPGASRIVDDLRAEQRVGARETPGFEIQTRRLTRETAQVCLGDVAAVLAALLAVEEFVEVPQLALPARGERRDLLCEEAAGSRVAVSSDRASIFSLPVRTKRRIRRG